MAMTEEMKQMLDAIKKYEKYILHDSCKRYFAPDIPDNVLDKIIKNFDGDVFINNIVAFFDTSVFNNCKSGLLFTIDGLYTKSIGKPEYIKYCDVFYVDNKKKTPIIQLRRSGEEKYIYIECPDTSKFKSLIYDLRSIDEEFGQTTTRSTGTVKKMNMPEDMKKKCHTIIHSAATAAGAAGAGLAQAIGSDNLVIMPVQVTMITTMGKKVFDLDITEAAAKSIIASAGASLTGRTASQFLVGWIPVIGNVINTATAAGITELIGWIAANDFYNRWLQDQNKGKVAGQKQGYDMASIEYEGKLKAQASEFLEQKVDVKKMVEEYEKLLNQYEEHIMKLQEENASLIRIAKLKEELENLKTLKEVG